MNKVNAFVVAVSLTSALTGCSPPQAPQNLELDPWGPNHVKISWTASPPNQENLVVNQDKFVIQRRENDSQYKRVAEVGSRSRYFIDDGVDPDTVYAYRVHATNYFGTSDNVSSGEYRHPYFDACATPPATGGAPEVFYDLPVIGLTYNRGSGFLVTDSDGSFGWDGTSNIDFSIGYVDIGRLDAGERAGLRSIANNIDEENRYEILNNLLRLFLALDEDGDATGIQLPCELSLASGEIDPTVSYDEFERQETVIALTGGAPLPSAKEARNTYKRYLFGDYAGHYELTWQILADGIFPIKGTISFDLDEFGDFHNTADTITKANINAHDNYHLHMEATDLAILVTTGYYKLEIDADIRPDLKVEGDAVAKGLAGNLKGAVWGKRTR